MAKKAILVSDLSGEEVTEDNGATVKVTYPGEEITHVIDLTRDEVQKLFSVKGNFVGRAQNKRGRKSNGSTAEATS